MAEITSEQVRQLRESSGAGMMDCKKALLETGGDMEAAVDWLRKKGLAAAAKKSGRAATEGLVAVAISGHKGSVIELNSETDFVARNEQFQALARNIAQAALEQSGDFDKLKSAVEQDIAQAIATIGENMNLRRSAALSVKEGVVASYVHNSAGPNLGKIGVLVALESAGDKTQLEALGKQIAMHVAAARPEALCSQDVDASALERERGVFREQAKASGKPAEIVEKMVEGRIRKYYEEVVLLEQVYVVDGKSKVSQVVADAAKTIGTAVSLTGFVRFQLGEGLDKNESDFASEVAAARGAA